MSSLRADVLNALRSSPNGDMQALASQIVRIESFLRDCGVSSDMLSPYLKSFDAALKDFLETRESGDLKNRCTVLKSRVDDLEKQLQLFVLQASQTIAFFGGVVKSEAPVEEEKITKVVVSDKMDVAPEHLDEKFFDKAARSQGELFVPIFEQGDISKKLSKNDVKTLSLELGFIASRDGNEKLRDWLKGVVEKKATVWYEKIVTAMQKLTVMERTLAIDAVFHQDQPKVMKMGGLEVLSVPKPQSFVEPSYDQPSKGSMVFSKKGLEKGNSIVELFQNASECWEKLEADLLSAREELLITGWDLNDKLKLRRPKEALSNVKTLSDILVALVARKVKVYIYVWSDAPGIWGKPYLGQTCGDGTSDSYVLSCAKNLQENGCKVKWGRPGDYMMLSHHQKTVVIDGNVAYLGGLDLAMGRWENGEYSVSLTHQKEHWMCNGWSGDWYNPELGHDQKGPREPWRDIHCRVEGHGALAVRQNFQQRWNKAVPNDVIPPAPARPQVDAAAGVETTVVRSILYKEVAPESSLNGMMLKEAFGCGTVGDVAENTILLSYLHAISKAERMIYIENQYFISSGKEWDVAEKNVTNSIAAALCKRIVFMKSCNKELKVVIILPLYPETGEGGPVKNRTTPYIIDHEVRTIRFMIRYLWNAGVDPLQHLLFLSPGRVESDGMRNMIYVHSKMMIVDEKFMILGSANINQRSMEGSRDSEICICFESAEKVSPFFTSCWQHWWGADVPYIDQGWSKCREIAFGNWKRYCHREEMRGLMIHPTYGMSVQFPVAEKDIKKNPTFESKGETAEGDYLQITI